MTDKHIKLLALDLDGTLLTTDKRLTARARDALQRASAAGVWIVPATGRIFMGLPEAIRALPFLRYAITCNGACVVDAAAEGVLYRAELDVPRALEIMSWLDSQPVIYDCTVDSHSWMSAAMYDVLEAYAPDPALVGYMRSVRTPVPDLKAFVRENARGVQKLQAFCRDVATQRRLLAQAPFPGLEVATSVTRNVEITREDATKGAALRALAAHLGLKRDEVMAVGDGLNDVSMLRAAGVGVAMENAVAAVRAAADVITAGNDADGVAAAIEMLILSNQGG
ncbi:MAG: Cof-type HAD-IIB family hydrolase [Clostridia bacterium]|nr:Cof-type HAD-IIB family hydrolase [Clostridia bacterium]